MRDSSKVLVALSIVAVLLGMAFLFGFIYGDATAKRECYELQKQRKF